MRENNYNDCKKLNERWWRHGSWWKQRRCRDGVGFWKYFECGSRSVGVGRHQGQTLGKVEGKSQRGMLAVNSSESESEVTQLCPTPCNTMDYSLPGSSIHGIFQARILEWVAIFFSRRSSQPRDWTRVSCTVGRHFTIWASRQVLRAGEISNLVFCLTSGCPLYIIYISIPPSQVTRVTTVIPILQIRKLRFKEIK